VLVSGNIGKREAYVIAKQFHPIDGTKINGLGWMMVTTKQMAKSFDVSSFIEVLTRTIYFATMKNTNLKKKRIGYKC
jgi:hypothetical protein